MLIKNYYLFYNQVVKSLAEKNLQIQTLQKIDLQRQTLQRNALQRNALQRNALQSTADKSIKCADNLTQCKQTPLHPLLLANFSKNTKPLVRPRVWEELSHYYFLVRNNQNHTTPLQIKLHSHICDIFNILLDSKPYLKSLFHVSSCPE